MTERDLSEDQKTIFIASYEGQRNKEGRRHGFGRFVAPKTGNVYEGYYFNDRKEGAGKMTYHQSGDVYEGDWKDNKKHGHGTYKWKNGNVYVGDWKDDTMHGQGKFTFASGAVYEVGSHVRCLHFIWFRA